MGQSRDICQWDRTFSTRRALQPASTPWQLPISNLDCPHSFPIANLYYFNRSAHKLPTCTHCTLPPYYKISETRKTFLNQTVGPVLKIRDHAATQALNPTDEKQATPSQNKNVSSATKACLGLKSILPRTRRGPHKLSHMSVCCGPCSDVSQAPELRAVWDPRVSRDCVTISRITPRLLSGDLNCPCVEYSMRKEETRLHIIGSCRRPALPISASNCQDSPIRRAVAVAFQSVSCRNTLK